MQKSGVWRGTRNPRWSVSSINSRWGRAVIRWSSIFMAASIAVIPQRSEGQDAAGFFKGRVITMLVGSSTGGGYDLNARVVAEHIRKHLPHNPSVVVKNMPGAGGLKAAGYMYAIAPKDGSELAILQRNLTIEPLFTKQPYDGTGFSWIGSASRDVSLCITSASSGLRTFDDLRSRQFIAAGQSSGSDSQVFAAMLKNLLGVNVKLVSGYPGTSDMMLALERGEADGMCGISYSSIKSRFARALRDRSIYLVAQAADRRDEELPDVPTLTELASNDDDRAVIKLLVSTQSMARPFLTSPGVPRERLAVLRAAFDRTMQDPGFIADATKRELEVSPLNGAAIEKLLRELYASPKSVTERAARAIAP